MKGKNLLWLLGLGLMVMAVGLVGCGAAIYEEIAYYDPNWLVDGRIMAVKDVIKHRSEGLPGYGRDITVSSAQYIVSMKDDGSEEKIIYGGEGKGIGIPVASPLGDYIAYRSGQYINIITADGTKEIKTIDCGETPQAMDWASDEAKMVFSGKDSQNLFVLSISNEGITKIATSAAEVAWRVGDKITFDGSWVNIIDPTGTNQAILIDYSWNPQKRSANEIIYEGADGVYSIRIDKSQKTKLFSNYEISTLKLSFDGSKIVGGKIDQRIITGIWVINIDGTNMRKLRD